jgi:CrcB protein
MASGAENVYAILYVGLGGFIGAVFRFMMSSAIQGSSRFPLGTLGVNIIGSFALSFITYCAEKSMALPESSRLFLAVGMLGAFTTMSTFSLETFRLLEERQNLLFLANMALNNILCLAGIYLGKLASSLI